MHLCFSLELDSRNSLHYNSGLKKKKVTSRRRSCCCLSELTRASRTTRTEPHSNRLRLLMSPTSSRTRPTSPQLITSHMEYMLSTRRKSHWSLLSIPFYCSILISLFFFLTQYIYKQWLLTFVLSYHQAVVLFCSILSGLRYTIRLKCFIHLLLFLLSSLIY